MSTKQIRGSLGLKKPETAQLKLELKKLVKDRKIKKQGTRFFIQKNSKHNNFSIEKINKDFSKKLTAKSSSNSKLKTFSNKIFYLLDNNKNFKDLAIRYADKGILV